MQKTHCKQACWALGSTPFVGDMGVASVQQDWLGCLARDLTLCWVVQEMPNYLPEDGAVSVPLLEIKSSWTCSMTMAEESLTQCQANSRQV